MYMYIVIFFQEPAASLSWGVGLGRVLLAAKKRVSGPIDRVVLYTCSMYVVFLRTRAAFRTTSMRLEAA